ncbi:MAG: UDP-N-acetylmuramoyl-L-alanine--D-glutamate ligase [Ahniella sp.]|nr:UDP-N-acetylmuramoyl-L-alanine--D-glutamate ligase [Ahniella sp.]
MRFAELEGKRLAVWGFGREGRAALMAVRRRYPELPVTVLCPEGEAAEVASLALNGVTVDSTTVDGAKLSAFDVIIKSPGISPHQDAVKVAKQSGVQFTSGSQLWFAEHRSATTVCVTATKGKSTTTSLIAFLLRSLGVRTALAGNIGLPLLEVPEDVAPPSVWVIELSSFQAFDAEARPTLAVFNNLLEEHLDWHGSVSQYRADKLRLFDGAKTCLINATDPVLARVPIADSALRRYLVPEGWHVANGWIRRGDHPVLPNTALSLPGVHNAENACAALAAVELLGFDALQAAPALAQFQPLPHRLHTLGERDGITYINDSIATTPAAAMAAFRHVREHGAQVAWIIGGHDRQLDWHDFLGELSTAPPFGLWCTGTVGARVYAGMNPVTRSACHAHYAESFDEAFSQAKQALLELTSNPSRILLLSPGAPSFGQFKDYVARGRRFAELAGFDAQLISGIGGLGIE